MKYEIEIFNKDPEIVMPDLDLLFPGKNIKTDFSKLYLITGTLDNDTLQKSVKDLFCDPVVEDYRIAMIENGFQKIKNRASDVSDRWEVTIYYHPEVTDPGSETIMKALNDVDIRVKNVITGKRYLLKGKGMTFDQVELITRRLLANYTVHDAFIKNI
ncbi:MAG: phosphoribosylformylglycinamidine synthase subunit PurS [Spirochaetes bacterium]|nr:phosphoribosylformylglycinamidine synthase subunit PurS [Spirochaetota bacterium]